MKCAICECALNPHKDERYDIKGDQFCSLLCVWRHRGKEKLA